MKQIWIVLVFAGWFIQIPDFSCAEDTALDSYKTARECYEAAMQINLKDKPESDQMKFWGRKFALLRRAITLDPKFTDAYIPYVTVFFEQPMGHELDNSKELDGFIELLKKGLEYNPPNGDEFLLKLIFVEDQRWEGAKNNEANIRKIGYADRGLIEFPKSKLVTSFLYSKADALEKLDRKDESIRLLENIVEIDPSSSFVTFLLVQHYSGVDNYEKMYKYSTSYLNSFGYQAEASDGVLFWKIESAYYLGYDQEALSLGKTFIALFGNRNNSELVNKKIYSFFSKIYERKGNSELVKKYKDLSD